MPPDQRGSDDEPDSGQQQRRDAERQRSATRTGGKGDQEPNSTRMVKTSARASA